MPKLPLGSLVEGEIFRFNDQTSEYSVVSFDGDFVLCRNLDSGKIIDVIR